MDDVVTQETTFLFEEWHGASVLPFAVTPKNEVYFLLGKGKEDRSWQPTSNRWCDFGGKRCYDQDKDPYYSGAREFLEEMAGCFCETPTLVEHPEFGKYANEYMERQREGWNKQMSVLPLEMRHDSNEEFNRAMAKEASEMKLGKYKLLIVRPSKDSETDKDNNSSIPLAFSKNKSFLTFVKQIKFSPELPGIFDRVVFELTTIADCARLYAVEYAETMAKPFKKATYSNMKTRIPIREANRWLGSTTRTIHPFVPRLSWGMLSSSRIKTLGNDGSCLHCVQCKAKTVACVSKRNKTNDYRVYISKEPTCESIHLVNEKKRQSFFYYEESKEKRWRQAKFVYFTLKNKSKETVLGQRLMTFREMTSRRTRLNQKLKTMSKGLERHPALSLFRDDKMPEDESVTFAMVRPEFLELQKIKWWSLERLIEVCYSNDSSYKGEQFRQWTVDVLPLVVRSIETLCDVSLSQ